MPPLQFLDGLDGFDAVAASLLLTGGDRERQQVDHDVGLAHPPGPREVGDESLGDRDLPLPGARLTFLVDGQRDHGRAVLPGHRHHPGEPRGRPVAVLEIDRVDDAAAAELLQAGLDDRRLGRVEHDRQRGRCRETLCNL